MLFQSLKFSKTWIVFTILFISSSILIAQPGITIAEKTKGMKLYNGFINYYWDESTGKIWLQIDELDKEILYQTSLPAGLGSNDIGLDRGIMGTTYIVKFSRIANKVLMIEPNYSYRAVSGGEAEKRAVEQSFAQSTIWGFTVAAQTGGSVLVDATDFIMRDALKVSNRLRSSKQGAYNLDASRSAMYLPRSKNFPLNTELETTLTFTNNDGQTGSFVNSVTPVPEAITLRVHHSFAQLPDTNFQTRLYDARSPYITNSYFDYSSPVNEAIQKNMIVRHRLEKKNPLALKSEAIKPIVYYLDNGTPEPIRSALLEGASWWNQAFEAAGFINAFQVKILPETADPMDLRYNMINWVHRSTRGWSYGDAVVDPRTGEIIKGNVTLGSLRVRQDYLIAQGLLAPFENNALPADDKMLKMALQRLKQLSAHEIGHTIGLMHNYISSAQNRASVMDYPPPMVSLNANNEIDLTNAYTNEIGEWDKVSIQYGYSQFPKGVNEAEALNKILSDAAKKGLTFISDRDARDPAGLHHFVRVRLGYKMGRRLGRKHLNHLMFGQPTPHVGAVFDAATALQGQTRDAQFFVQPPRGASKITLAPAGMGATGVRPQPRRVVFAQGPALQQNLAPAHDKDRHRLVTQAALMHLKLFHLGQGAVYPSRDHLAHV